MSELGSWSIARTNYLQREGGQGPFLHLIGRPLREGQAGGLPVAEPVGSTRRVGHRGDATVPDQLCGQGLGAPGHQVGMPGHQVGVSAAVPVVAGAAALLGRALTRILTLTGGLVAWPRVPWLQTCRSPIYHRGREAINCPVTTH